MKSSILPTLAHLQNSLKRSGFKVKMMQQIKRVTASFVRHMAHGAVVVMVATSAQARDDCDVPINDWQTRDAVRALAETKGWTLQRIKIDDGCYEVHGTDQEGKRFEAKIDPATLTVIEIEPNHKRR